MSSVCKLSRFKSELKYFIIVLNDIPVLQPQPQWIKVVFIVKNHSIQIKLKTILEWFLMKNDFFHFLISGHSIFEWAIAGLSFFFKNGPNPASFSLFSSFQYTVDSEQMFNVNKFLPMTALLYQLSHNHHLSFFIFIFSQHLSENQLLKQSLLMAGFEPVSSCAGSNHSANCVTPISMNIWF